jgi:inhibitor of KinA sporulation pathway (predicted exonuclease)
MDSIADIDRKRKAEIDQDQLQEAPSKRPFVESTETEEQKPATQNTDEPFYDANNTEATETTEPKVESEIIAEASEEDQQQNTKAESADTAEITTASPPLVTNVPFDRLIVLHLEATCDENPTNPAAVQVTKENSEIIGTYYTTQSIETVSNDYFGNIELSFVVLNASNLEVLYKQQIYVKPERTPLTPFCSEVTGIRSSMLENAGNLSDAIKQLDEYIQREIESEKKSFCFVTHGGWVLRIQLAREARDKNLSLPNYLAYCRMFDLKQEIQRWQVHHPEVNLRSTSLRDLCDIFEITRTTDQTVGLNAALTTVKIVRHLASFRHPDVFVHAIDTNADLKQFKKEESQVIHLAGLPFEVTQGELEAWFSSNGLRPTTMWMIQPTDNSKPSISGFVVFGLHDDAMRALSLNGRCLGDRPIEVCPSSSRVIDAAGNMLVPFPLQAKSRQLRPGDWNCFNCSFHNFASRLYCFKCNAENPNPGPQAGQGPPPQPFSHGDWMCPNPSCNFHNYASRMHCKKCAGPKPILKKNKTLKLGGGAPIVHQAPLPQQPSYHVHGHGPPGASGGPPPTGPSGGYHGGYNSGGRPHHHISFRPGDWYCPNSACGFQNFASRHTCFRCHTPNPNQGQQQQQQQQPAASQHAQYSPHQPGYGYSPEPTNSYQQQQQQQSGYHGNNSGGYGYGHQPGGGSGSNYNNNNGGGGYAPPGGGYGGGGGNNSGYAYGGGGYAYGGGGASQHQPQQSSGPPGGTQFRAGDWIW